MCNSSAFFICKYSCKLTYSESERKNLMYNCLKFWKSKGIKLFIKSRGSRSTAYEIIKEYESGGTKKRKGGSGGSNAVSQNIVKKVIRCSRRSKRFSLRNAVKAYRISKDTVSNILKRKGISAYKKQKIP